jgi:hypothetical protein
MIVTNSTHLTQMLITNGRKKTMRDAMLFIVLLAVKLFVLSLCFSIFAQLVIYNQVLAFTFAFIVLMLVAAS